MAEKLATAKIRIGPAGWFYKDWIGIVYSFCFFLEMCVRNSICISA